jgi:hypothetical protein
MNGRSRSAAWTIRGRCDVGGLRQAAPRARGAKRSFRRAAVRGDLPFDDDPSKRNGLREVSQIAIDKITVVPVAKIGDVIGEASDALLLRVNRALALFLGIV